MRRLASAAATLFAASAAVAGPPFLTDDPVPTDKGHWENYAPFVDSSGKGRDYGGATGTEFNYGAFAGVQLTVELPIAYSHDANGWRQGRGDIGLSAKYRFYHDDKSGVSIAAFPGVTLPTASHQLGNPKVTALLPVWAEKDIGAWSIFGGGGYAINPGAGNRNYWTGGLAVTRQCGKSLLIGIEVDPQGPDTIDGQPSISFGAGGIVKLGGPFRLLASAGPTLTRHERTAGFHGFAALGIDF